MAEKLHKLSLVAQYDDIVRNRAILTAGIETGDYFLRDKSIWLLLALLFFVALLDFFPL